MNSITKKFYLDIEISKGMKVLDVGCGKGATTELIAEIVGENGKVIGIDSNRNALYRAEQNINLNKLKNINYICADLSNLDIENNKFDAIVGRRILKYLPDPKSSIKQLSKLLKPSGVMGFQEHDSTNLINDEKMPLHSKVNNWIRKLV
ncbi:MAG: class I SAM-dependent methyltransferase [Aureispira sp.]|nr:class I SAM-dependent methyltransferase [Aureispira sp.]